MKRILELHGIKALKGYYSKREVEKVSDFKDQYVKKIEDNLTGKIKDLNLFLIQETVLNSNDQLSLVNKINEDLIPKDYDLPYYSGSNIHKSP